MKTAATILTCTIYATMLVIGWWWIPLKYDMCRSHFTTKPSQILCVFS